MTNKLTFKTYRNDAVSGIIGNKKYNRQKLLRYLLHIIPQAVNDYCNHIDNEVFPMEF